LLRIRLTRTGKKKQPSFRLVVAEKSKAVQRKYLEILGQYVPSAQPKVFNVKKDRIEHWIKMGALPSDTVAALLKKEGFADMDKYMEPRNKKRSKKKEAKEAPVQAPKSEGPAKTEEAVKTEEKPSKEEPKKEESKPEEATEK
jgi:small subunit ribosomal protein S16